MSKTHSRYVCQQCGYQSSRWMGRCPECGEWNTMVESLVDSPSRSVSGGTAAPAQTLTTQAFPLGAIPPYAQSRIPVPMEELGRVLGGGEEMPGVGGGGAGGQGLLGPAAIKIYDALLG